MLDNTLMAALSRSISTAEGMEIKLDKAESLSGGDSNQAYRVTGNDHHYFVKTNQTGNNRNFETEAVSLNVLAAAKVFRVPRVISCGRYGDSNYLILEYIPMRQSAGKMSGESARAWGQALALLHRNSCAVAYGWSENNFIGATPQANEVTGSWADFFACQRIAPQVVMANRNGAGLVEVDQVIEWVQGCLRNHCPQASLLHGDLWCGNASVSEGGEPLLFDPASYYGDRETDLAMARLFGGFPQEFYRSYAAQWPLAAGAQQRAGLYQLYHLLNHYNLFGGHYLQRANAELERLRREFS